MDLKIALTFFWGVIALIYMTLALIALRYRFEHKGDLGNIRKAGATVGKELAESIAAYSDKIAKVNSIGFLVAALAAIATVITLTMAY